MSEQRFSLFGGPTPEDIRRQIMGEREQIRAASLANMQQGQRGQVQGSQALGDMIGRGISRLFGWNDNLDNDPRVQAAEQQQQVLQPILQNAWEQSGGDQMQFYQNAITGLTQAGLYDQAFELHNQFAELQNEQAQAQQRTAQAERHGIEGRVAIQEAERRARDQRLKETAQQWKQEYQSQRLGQLGEQLAIQQERLELAERQEDRLSAQTERANILADMAKEYSSAIAEKYGVTRVEDIPNADARARELERLRQFYGSMDGIGMTIFSQLAGAPLMHEMPQDVQQSGGDVDFDFSQ